MLLREREGPTEGRAVISLFSGAMGLDAGLEQAGLAVAVGQDMDSSCVQTMRANKKRVLSGDIRGMRPGGVLEAAGLKRGEAFLVSGGPPCQPFSTAGRQRGLSDPQGSLFLEFIRMVEGIAPRFFVMENVKGLTSAPAQPRRRNGRGESWTASDAVLDGFAGLGYRLVHGVLDAVNYGTPQFRERFVIMGSRDQEDVFLPIPTHFQTHQDPKFRWATLRSAIGDLEGSPGECAAFRGARLALLKMVPPGGNWRSLPGSLQEEAMGGAYRSGGGKVGFYRRLSYDEPSPTLVTSPVQKASMLCHPTEDRPLSVREYARLQEFPDGWEFSGSTMEKYRQIGNAVPQGLGRAIGMALLAAAEGTATVRTKRMRGTGIHQRIRDVMESGRDLARGSLRRA